MLCKKLYLFFASTLLLAASCSKEPSGFMETASPQIVADIELLTKTELDLNTFALSWAEGDNLSVFNAKSGSTDYSSNLKYLLSDVQSGCFQAAPGVLVPFEDNANYDWFAISPWQQWATGPNAKGSVTLSTTQTQTGNNNAAHLSKSDILAGKALSTRSPKMSMSHLGTLMKWTVKNTTDSPVIINSISFSPGVVVCGAYKVDLTSGNPVLDAAHMGSSSYSTANLQVNSGELIATGESADYYQILAPFSLPSGSDVSISIAGSAGKVELIKHFSSSVSFSAGRYNTAVLEYNPSETPDHFTFKKNDSGKWRLYKGEEEFHIKGVAANRFYDKVADYGANTIRTYSISGSKAALDTALANGIYVLVGIGIGREKDGFDYDDESAVAAQKESIRSQVSSILGHKAILGWIVGNEADASYTNSKLWSAVEEIAAMIKTMDPYHPVSTALAGTKEKAINDIKTLAPSIDFLCINTYYPNCSIASSLANYGWEKPWIISEFGPSGTWSSSVTPHTDWGSCIEQTSTQKAAIYKLMSEIFNANLDDGCLGSCAFVWGYQTHGDVLSWYGLFNKDAYSFAAVDELQKIWNGSYPSALAPVISDRNAMLIDDSKTADDNVVLFSSSAHGAKVMASSPAGVALRYKWLIYKEGTASSDGSLPDGISGLIGDDTLSEIAFVAPSEQGLYRLMVFAFDDTNKKLASASIPFKVESQSGGAEIDSWTAGNIGW